MFSENLIEVEKTINEPNAESVNGDLRINMDKIKILFDKLL